MVRLVGSPCSACFAFGVSCAVRDLLPCIALQSIGFALLALWVADVLREPATHPCSEGHASASVRCFAGTAIANALSRRVTLRQDQVVVFDRWLTRNAAAKSLERTRPGPPLHVARRNCLRSGFSPFVRAASAEFLHP